MCGINGIFRRHSESPPIDRSELLRTRGAMARRGPDHKGEWVGGRGQVAFGHCRLAIIDLSDAGVLPMSTPDGRYTLVYNGEIYNYRELRRELIGEGVVFRSHSDAEVLLQAYAKWGAKAVARLRGMFAFAVWDDHRQELVLVRDRFGIKPLYYSVSQDAVRFASQVKALEVGGALELDVDPAAVVGFLLWGSVPEPMTIRKEIRALPAGTMMRVSERRVDAPARYEDPSPERRHRLDQTVGEALADSVRAHLVADVPVGVFLSAGVDSSLVADLASREAGQPPTALTLRFEEFVGTEWDEGPLARETAAALGLEYIERMLSKSEFRALEEDFFQAMDQPTIDGLNTYLVSRAARETGLKVALSGLGGDELFGGYPSFIDVERWCRISAPVSRLPGFARLWPRLVAGIDSKPKLRGLLRYSGTVEGAYFLRRALFLPEEIEALLDHALAAEGLAAYDPVADGRAVLDDSAHTPGDGVWRAVQRLESSLYMRNQLLRDTDWSSMASSVEVRVPLVDEPLLEVVRSWQFEPARSVGKAKAVRGFAPRVPARVFERPKTGFFVPASRWMSNQAHRTWGEASRTLALRVLEEFEIPLA